MSIFHLKDQQELTWHIAVLKEGKDGFEGVNLTPPDAVAGRSLSTSFRARASDGVEGSSGRG
jgi:hypothetical protein